MMLPRLCQRSSQQFLQLKNVSIGAATCDPIKSTRGDHFSQDLGQILSFFYLPSLEYLSVHLTEPDIFKWPLSGPPVASRLQSLTLHHSELNERTLREILVCTPELTYLDYDYWHDIEDYRTGKPRFLNVQDLYEALDLVSGTLRTLRLRVNIFVRAAADVTDGLNGGVKGSFASLQRFVRLRRLDVPLVLLLGMRVPAPWPKLNEALPSSLRELVVSDGLMEWEGCLRQENDWDETAWTGIMDYLQEGMTSFEAQEFRRLEVEVRTRLGEPLSHHIEAESAKGIVFINEEIEG